MLHPSEYQGWYKCRVEEEAAVAEGLGDDIIRAVLDNLGDEMLPEELGLYTVSFIYHRGNTNKSLDSNAMQQQL